MNKLVFVAMAAIFAMPIATAFAQTTTTGNVQIAGTCGIGTLTPISYGVLTPAPNTAGPEQILTVTNTGTVPGTLMVLGSHWNDFDPVTGLPIGNVEIFVQATYFGTTSTPSGLVNGAPAPPPPGFETALQVTYQPITSTDGFAVGPNLTYWQMIPSLINPSFTGTLTQELTFSASC
jgi:hypothetical protein